MFNNRLREARLRANLTQAQLADAIGVAKSTLTGYELGNSEPDMNKIEQFMSVLKVDANFLFQDEMAKHGGYPRRLTYKEEMLVDRWRKLDSHGRNAVNAIIDVEYDRCTSNAKSRLEIRMISMPVYTDPAAAGFPQYAESEFDRMDFPQDEVPSQADFGVRISGNSMEPTIHDGQIVWVCRKSTIDNQHIGVFMMDGGNAVCKRATVCADGRVTQLLSDNPAYDPMVGEQLNGLRLVGEVIL